MVTMIGVGVERPGFDEMQLTRKTSFANGFTAVTNIVFAYCMSYGCPSGSNM